jgi:hypothetical protein
VSQTSRSTWQLPKRPSIQDRLRRVAADTAALLDFQTRSKATWGEHRMVAVG